MLKMKTTITGVAGIGPQTAKTLHEHGFNTLSAVAAATIEQLSRVPGFSTTRASRVIRAANELIATSTTSTARAAHSEIRRSNAVRNPAGSKPKSGQSKDTSAKEMTKKEQKKAAKLEKKLEKEKAKEKKHKKKMEKKAKRRKKKEMKARLKKETKARKKKSKHRKDKK